MSLQSILVFGLIATALIGVTEGVEFRLDLDNVDGLDTVFERSRDLLTPSEKKLLEEILKGDDAMMDRQRLGILDQILATISGVSSVSSGLTNLVGGSSALVSGAPAAPAAPATAATVPVSNASAPAPAIAPATMTPAAMAPQGVPNDNHLFSQISKVVMSSGGRNVTGIVDEALKIGTPAPVRDLVNGILQVAYCNGIRRLLGRC